MPDAIISSVYDTVDQARCVDPDDWTEYRIRVRLHTLLWPRLILTDGQVFDGRVLQELACNARLRPLAAGHQAQPVIIRTRVGHSLWDSLLEAVNSQRRAAAGGKAAGYFFSSLPLEAAQHIQDEIARAQNPFVRVDDLRLLFARHGCQSEFDRIKDTIGYWERAGRCEPWRQAPRFEHLLHDVFTANEVRVPFKPMVNSPAAAEFMAWLGHGLRTMSPETKVRSNVQAKLNQYLGQVNNTAERDELSAVYSWYNWLRNLAIAKSQEALFHEQTAVWDSAMGNQGPANLVVQHVTASVLEALAEMDVQDFHRMVTRPQTTRLLSQWHRAICADQRDDSDFAVLGKALATVAAGHHHQRPYAALWSFLIQDAEALANRWSYIGFFTGVAGGLMVGGDIGQAAGIGQVCKEGIRFGGGWLIPRVQASIQRAVAHVVLRMSY